MVTSRCLFYKQCMTNELRMIRRIENENIVKFHENFETQSEVILIQELISGGELLQRL